MSSNPLVSFLRHYGPIPASENMYDELIQSKLLRHEIEPAIEIPPHRLDELLDNFRSSEPKNVILTGTAGDGKTYHCRRVWEELGGDPVEWQKGSKVNSLPLPSAEARLFFVKDLSELRPDEKDNLYPDISKSIHFKQEKRIFLIAANDGQLVATLRGWADSEGQEARDDFVEIQRMLVKNDEESTSLFLSLYNLSRSEVANVFDELLEQIVEHPLWGSCSGCPIHDDEANPECPIRINRGLLRRSSDSLLRQRLKDLLKLSSANRMHLPIRHLLLLVVNVILGDQKSGQSLLNCRTAKNRAKDKDYNLTSPFANVFGENLLERERTQYQAFNALAHFGVGMETDNAFDNLLIYGPFTEDDRYKKLVGGDNWYGDSPSYRRLVENYVEGEREMRTEFLSALANQRRRLFFSLEDDAYDDLDPWRLTVYRHSGQFLHFCRSLAAGEDVARVQTQLIRGLNRTFCGLMIDTGDQAFLGMSGGDGRGRLANLVSFVLPTRRSPRAHYIRFVLSSDQNIPMLEVLDPTLGDKETAVIESIELQLIHFEYLMRVATGSLPASFSRQCYEDFLDLKLRLVEKLGKELKDMEEEGADTLEFTALTLDEAGRPDHQTYTIRFESLS